MDKVIFSIVAKNYIPMANALGDSIKHLHPDIPFFIVVADKEDGVIRFDEQRYPIIPSASLGIEQLEEMAFKYNVTEFCTSLKPFAFDYFLERGHKQIIYFDPDILVFSKLNDIFDRLSQHSLVATPHICTMQTSYTGLVPEGMLLHVGTFNFGFCGISSNKNGLRIVEWWKSRLIDKCYGDKIDGLHTDQKWMDFMPSLIEDLHIEKGLGYNIAIWNWHERQIEDRNGVFWVSNRIDNSGAMPLVFFHYSNFAFSQAGSPALFRPKYIQKFPDLHEVSNHYSQKLDVESMGEYSHLYKYTFACFDNGVLITHFHRRLFRRLIESGYIFDEPFTANKNSSLYNLLKKSELINESLIKVDSKYNEENFSGFEKKLKYIRVLAKFMKRIIGIQRYSLLCKFGQRFVRPENQTFLIDGAGSELPFYNENRYINWEVDLDNKVKLQEHINNIS